MMTPRHWHYVALWEYQARHNGSLPTDVDKAGEIEAIAADIVTNAQVNRQALPNVPKELVEYVWSLCLFFFALTSLFLGVWPLRPHTSCLLCAR